MKDVFKRMLHRGASPEPGESAAVASLRRRLQAYPPYAAPHAGWVRTLSAAQAQANLAHCQAVLPARLQQLGELLRDEVGIDTATALADPHTHAGPLADRLGAWALSSWPAQLAGRDLTITDWLVSPRSGADIVFSLATDVALLLGELVRRANAEWRWGLDDDEDHIRRELASARRVVLRAEPIGAKRDLFVLDLEEVVATLVFRPANATLVPGAHAWRRAVEGGIRGDAMAFWKAEVAAGRTGG